MSADTLAERIQERARKSYQEAFGYGAEKGQVEWATKFALSELSAAEQAARKEEREQCCKVLCHFCRSGDVPELIKQSGAWLHGDEFEENAENGSWPFHCKASAIRNRE